jgi:transposase
VNAILYVNRAGCAWELLPRRWAVERTLGWLMLHRRLVRDFETLPNRSRTMIHWAVIHSARQYLSHRQAHQPSTLSVTARSRTDTS